ncbi:FliA/WhiG family RNA polymerase sigma factor [Gracilibacillus sp. YIM 98692]|uniref:FliA/WhiG family RNA polymerase sigma factor n=1 Tax=Gracilibacillus sp. YIM 98692 TaxID=2663532 RepID=UPI0013D3A620|nr:FliA/WhiG family RNA polymerase sigma factor [Gracilibacillus sp. YIM 98692]
MAKEQSEELLLWENWRDQRNDENTNKLVDHYMYLVQYHVQRIASNLPRSVQTEDIKSLALFGLYDAILKFDFKRDLKFDTYASFRIKGAIIDGLRKEDWLPRSQREKVKKVEQVTEQLEQHLQREVTVEEIAQKTQLSKGEVEEVMKNNFFSNLLSIEDKGHSQAGEMNEGIGYLIPDESEITPEENVVKQEEFQELAKYIQQLKEKEQLVISLFYEKELTFTEIGNVLNLTTSRISQIHKQAIYKVSRMYQKK